MLGGWYVDKVGIFRGLWVLGLWQALSNLGYAAAAWAVPAVSITTSTPSRPENARAGVEAARKAGVPRVVGWRCEGIAGVEPFDAFLAARHFHVANRVVLAAGRPVGLLPNLRGELAIYRFRRA